MGRIVLTLKSNLCASSGQSFSSVVDNDIVTDNFGLPYIPARRIKGCLREAAEYIESKATDRLFGVKGSECSGALKIGNGYLKDCEALKAVLSARDDCSKQRITEVFTDIKAQTAIADDTVKDGSLRFTRTLSHYLPYNNAEETSFVFSVSGVGDNDKKEFERICKALRHIGLMRTRGLGFVKTEYDHQYNGDASATPEIYKRDGCFRLPLHVLLIEPLLIASRNNIDCMEYVPGAAVLGAFARMAVLDNMSPGDFEKLFLSGKVRFGNLYISDERASRTVPAPTFMKKLKSTNMEKDGVIVTEYQASNGIPVTDNEKYNTNEDVPKALRNKYVRASDLSEVISVFTETQYHHSRGKDSILYSQDSISAGQYLYGEVESSDKALLEKLTGLLQKHDLRLGRSRSAQYSGCRLLNCKRQDKQTDAPKGSRLVFVLESDVILLDDKGRNTIDPNELKKALCSALGIQEISDAEYDLGFKLIHGYNAKRNMRNFPAVAIAMGSTVTLPNVPAGELTIGVRNSEGFGRVKVYSEADIVNKTIPAEEEADTASDADDRSSNAAKDAASAFNAFLDGLLTDEKAFEKAEKAFEENSAAFSKTRLNAAFVGMVSRMIETAGNAEEAIERIKKIKDESKKTKIQEILNAACLKEAPDKIKLEGMLTVLRLAKYRLRYEKKGGGADE